MVPQDNPPTVGAARRSRLTAGLSAAALLALLSAPSAMAFRLDVLDGTVLDAVAMADGEAASFDFVYRFQMERGRSLEFLVVPDRGNPVYLNGTAGSAGWWTEVQVVEEDEQGEEGEPPEAFATDGSESIELGYLPDDEPILLRLRIHAPPEALRHPGEVVASFRLVEDSSRWDLFGGDDPPEQQDVQTTITLLQGAESHGAASSGQGASAPPTEWNAPQVALVAGSAIMALGLIAIFGGGRR